MDSNSSIDDIGVRMLCPSIVLQGDHGYTPLKIRND